MEKQVKRTIDFRYAPDVNQTCIGFADDLYKSIVREDGSINCGFLKKGYRHYNSFKDQSGDRVVSPVEQNLGFRYRFKPVFLHRDKYIRREQSYGDSDVAMVVTTEYYKKTVFSWKIFAYRNNKGTRADIIWWKLTASENFRPAATNILLNFSGDQSGAPQVVSSPVYKTVKTKDDTEDLLHAGEVMEGVFAILHNGELQPEQLTMEWVKNAENQTLSYWKNLNPFRTALEIPDDQVMDMLKACGRNILQARETVDDVTVFQVGPTLYRGLWMVDGYFLLESAHMMGRSEEAFDGFLSVLRHIKPDGAIRIMPLHHKETGIALAMIVRQCELVNDDGRLRELWPTMKRALEYIRSLMESAKAMGEEYKGHDLFPPAFGDGGLYGSDPEYTTPLWILAGLKRAYEAGKRLKLHDYSDFKETYDEIMKGFRKSIARDRKYTKNVQNFLELLDDIDNEEGIPENTGWMSHQAVWPYSSMFYAEVWLYAGNGEKAADYLYSFANHASPGRVWREEQALADSNSAEICGDMPHNWASAEFIRLVRNMLVFERAGNLELFYGLPVEWLPKEGKRLYIEKTPTRYGKITIELTLKSKGEYELAFVREKANQSPVDIILNWKGAVTESDVKLEQIGGNRWRLPAGCSKYRMKLTKASSLQ